MPIERSVHLFPKGKISQKAEPGTTFRYMFIGRLHIDSDNKATARIGPLKETFEKRQINMANLAHPSLKPFGWVIYQWNGEE